MIQVYSASNGLEAHMIKNLLQNEGIDAQVQGEYLTGGIGDLPASDLVKVYVANVDVEHAARIIQQWEAHETKHAPKNSLSPKKFTLGFIEGLVIGAIVAFAVCKLSVE